MSSISSLETESNTLIRQYLDLFPLSQGWHYQQSQYQIGVKNDWQSVKRRIGSDSILRHLDRGERFWIGSKCREVKGKAVTTFLLIDLDANDGREVAWGRLSRIREAFGKELLPLVYTSPGGGYHAIWFFDRPLPLAALVDLAHPVSGGLMADVLRSVVDKYRPGFCEVFPQPNKCLRWPLGTDQQVVDLATGLPLKGMDLPALLDAAERHRATVPRLTLEHLRSLRPTPVPEPRTAASVKRRATVPLLLREVGSGIGLEAIQAGCRAYRNGLTEPGSRNEVMFAVARVMVLAPDALAEFGFDSSGDKVAQLLAWLQTKHNGHSKEFAARPDDRDHWWAECDRVLRCVEEWDGTVRRGLDLFLSEAEWDSVFMLGAGFQGRPTQRHRVELVAACWLRMAKWSVVRGRGYRGEDGTFVAEIHWKWRRQIPFCRRWDAERSYREMLQDAGLFRFEKPGDWETHHASLFSGFRLDVGGVQPERRYSVARLLAAAEQLEGNVNLLAYCVEAEARFQPEQLQQRYGRSGAKFIREHLTKLDRAAGETSTVLQLPAGSGFRGLPDARDSFAA